MLRLAFIGNLGGAPELRFTPNGDPVLRFSVAAQFGVRDREGTWEHTTEWISVVLFGKRAESLQEILEKGMRVYVDGRLAVRPWTDRGNNPRAGLEVIADSVEMMTVRRREDDDSDTYGKDYGDIPDNSLPF
jgi:single-strand DNA-binding protein